MLNNGCAARHSLETIIESLVIKEEENEASYQTRTGEEYKAILMAALSGLLQERISVGRSGIYLDNRRINPPQTAVS